MNMYTVAEGCPSNEELALRVQSGDQRAAELLISQNEGYITNLALKHVQRCELEDMKQEGTMALLEAAKRFDPSYGTKLLTAGRKILCKRKSTKSRMALKKQCRWWSEPLVYPWP